MGDFGFMLNKFRKICLVPMCALVLNTVSVGATNITNLNININMQNIGEICPKICQSWLDDYLRMLINEYLANRAFDWRIYKEKILEDIKKLIIEKGAANIDLWDLINVISCYTYKGDKILIKFRKSNGDFQFMKDPCLKIYSIGGYQSINPEKLIEYFENSYKGGVILDFDKIAKKTIEEKCKKGLDINKSTITTKDVIDVFNFEKLDGYTLKEGMNKAYIEMKKDLESKYKKEVSSVAKNYFAVGCLVGGVAGIFATFGAIFSFCPNGGFTRKNSI